MMNRLDKPWLLIDRIFLMTENGKTYKGVHNFFASVTKKVNAQKVTTKK